MRSFEIHVGDFNITAVKPFNSFCRFKVRFLGMYKLTVFSNTGQILKKKNIVFAGTAHATPPTHMNRKSKCLNPVVGDNHMTWT